MTWRPGEALVEPLGAPGLAGDFHRRVIPGGHVKGILDDVFHFSFRIELEENALVLEDSHLPDGLAEGFSRILGLG
jgi:hypothetical protein